MKRKITFKEQKHSKNFFILKIKGKQEKEMGRVANQVVQEKMLNIKQHISSG